MPVIHRNPGNSLPDWDPLKKVVIILFGVKPPPGWLEKQKLKKLKGQTGETPAVQSIVDEIVRQAVISGACITRV